jgi:ABC-type glutathione transport system ATPase component
VTAPLLEVRGLSVRFAGRQVLAGVDLCVAHGEIVGLAGPSGCGKTTLLRAAIGAAPRVGGEVRTLGVDPDRASDAELGALRRRAQYLPQDASGALNPAWTARAALIATARLHGRSADAADAALAEVGLAHRSQARPDALSGGERRRLTLAMLALANPELVLADEPTAGLDAARKAEVIDRLVGLGRASLIVSHDLALLLYRCTRIVVMDGGRIVDAFAPHDAGDRAHPTTRRLLGARAALA